MAANYLLLETDDLVTFCSFHNPFPSPRADWATFLSSINYLAVVVSMASLASLANPF